MIARRLDASHDWTFGSSKANYAQKSEAIAQCIKTSLLSFRFNWFLDEDHGVNWFAYFVKNPNVPVMESDIKRHVLEVEGVQSLQDLPIQLDTVTRELIVTVKYTDIYSNQRQELAIKTALTNSVLELPPKGWATAQGSSQFYIETVTLSSDLMRF